MEDLSKIEKEIQDVLAEVRYLENEEEMINSKPVKDFIKTSINSYTERAEKYDRTYRDLDEDFRKANTVFMEAMMIESKETDLGKKALFDAIRNGKKKIDKLNSLTKSIRCRTTKELEHAHGLCRQFDDPNFRMTYDDDSMSLKKPGSTLEISSWVIDAFSNALDEFAEIIKEVHGKT
ncbi:hypothetical protein TNCT_266141 [Trichonephila clavata]|uniref:Uncharacterized protein n=1 Tax=Trichonephila clavata TaxID=2740835 RepID=A0A8X6I4F5_TRICU|nr:hypothetical protein TNCT_266141 [Trichonephila clavata]